MPDPTPQSRSVRGWVVKSRKGHTLLYTVRELRREARAAFFDRHGYLPERSSAYRAVRCFVTPITTDPPAPKEGA